MRMSVERFLPEASGEARVEALRLAHLVGDRGTADLCLRILGEPEPLGDRTREERLAVELAVLVAQDRGSAEVRSRALSWALDAVAQDPDPVSRRWVRRMLRADAGGGGTDLRGED
jgi:hypothetical protein